MAPPRAVVWAWCRSSRWGSRGDWVFTVGVGVEEDVRIRRLALGERSSESRRGGGDRRWMDLAAGHRSPLPMSSPISQVLHRRRPPGVLLRLARPHCIGPSPSPTSPRPRITHFSFHLSFGELLFMLDKLQLILFIWIYAIGLLTSRNLYFVNTYLQHELA